MSEKYEYKKRFYDLEKEERWLNEMCGDGLVLKKIEWGLFADKYIFEPCDKKYVCRVDYNPEMDVLEEITSPYTMFVTGTYGAEFICCANGKLYFRKAEESGDFPPIYTSLESRIAAEKNQIKRYTPILIIIAFYAVLTGVMIYDKDYDSFWGAMFIGMFFTYVLLTAAMILRHIFKIRSLKRFSANGNFPPENTYEKFSLDEAEKGFRNSVICAVCWLIIIIISVLRFAVRGWQPDLAANIALVSVQGITEVFWVVSAVRFRKKIKNLKKEKNEKGGK